MKKVFQVKEKHGNKPNYTLEEGSWHSLPVIGSRRQKHTPTTHVVFLTFTVNLANLQPAPCPPLPAKK